MTLSVDAGEIRGLIGPNGAGKTTLFNLLTGVLRPTAGRVRFDEADITGEPTHRLVRRGIVRTYQLSQLFAGFTVFRNVLSALHVHARSGFWAGLLETARDAPPERRADASARWRSSASSASAGARTTSPAACRTATSGCCRSRWAWRRRRGCCCWTNRWPACCMRTSTA